MIDYKKKYIKYKLKYLNIKNDIRSKNIIQKGSSNDSNQNIQEWEKADNTISNGAMRDVMNIEFRIFCNGFWGGEDFLDRTTSGNTNVNFFIEVFNFI